MDVQYNPSKISYYIMAKPIGAVCNLDCTYCYYLEKEKLYPNDPDKYHMSDKVLELFIASYILGQTDRSILFTWHGGEPIMRGMDFFNKVLELQKKYGAGKTIENSLQTNGTLLTDDWCKFFKDNHFLIGLSIDGTEHCHDHYRTYKDRKPSFVKTMKGVELLIKHGVEFNTLSVVNDYNSKYPLEVYRFLKQIGSRYMQFIPIVEWIDPEAKSDQLSILTPNTPKKAIVTDWSVNPSDYGKFLIAIFDEWVSRDVGTYYVITFDAVLANWAGEPPAICVYAKNCGHAGVMEFNGDVYSCDHFVFPEYKLGNVRKTSLEAMMHSDFQKKFGRDKRDKLPRYCFQCEFLNICTGECPKNRFLTTPDGQPGLNYLCAGFKLFYAHTAPYMKFMVNELKNNRAPSNVMEWIKQKQSITKPVIPIPIEKPIPKKLIVHRNDPCPCGSGKLYKKCCALKPKSQREF
jgi:uncharacterized protein